MGWSDWSGAGGAGRGEAALEVSSGRPAGGGDIGTEIFLLRRSQPCKVLGGGGFGVLQEQQGDLCYLSIVWVG